MKKFHLSALIVAAFAALTLLSACEKKEAPPPPQTEAPAPAAPAPAPAPDAPPATSMPAPSDAMPAAPAAGAEMPTPAAALPPECEEYLATVNACAQKQANNPATADALKQQMEQTRASWAQISDQAALAGACKQAAEAFAQTAKNMGC